MPKPFTPKIVTANALLEGDVVYQTATGWSRDFAAAEVLTELETAQARLAHAQIQAGQIVGAYLADVTLDAADHRPGHFREVFRARGPSNYPHGKQEQI
ncbi:MAG: DUF2849 domain-containing protein [Pseudomonadota bacterium]